MLKFQKSLCKCWGLHFLLPENLSLIYLKLLTSDNLSELSDLQYLLWEIFGRVKSNVKKDKIGIMYDL